MATVAYPFIVYFGLSRFEPRVLALLLLLIVAARALLVRDRLWLGAALGACVLVAVTAIKNDGLALKLYPALVNAVMLMTFVLSLRYPPSAIERLARLREPNLSTQAITYTRKLTVVWCGFFIVNGLTAVATALFFSEAVWALYNGLIAYVLMGILFFGEQLLRPKHTSVEHD